MRPSIFLLCLTFSIAIYCSCNHSPAGAAGGNDDSGAQKDNVQDNVQKGKVLAATYCRLCHLLPDPSLLDKRSWVNDVLPGMAPRLGMISKEAHNTYDHYNEMLGKTYYPAAPLLKPEEWQHIIEYYSATAPDTLPRPVRSLSIIPELSQFSIQTPAVTFTPPASCMVRIDTLGGRHELLVSDAKTSRLLRFDQSLRMIDSMKSNGPIVDITLEKNRMLACNIGYLNPTDIKLGSAEFITAAPAAGRKTKMEANKPFFEKLARPVQITPADLNQDHRTDYLICEFGNLAGSLSWMENTGDGKFTKHVLRDMPGAIKAYVQDLNHDGLPDIIALFAQGDEGIFLYTNKGHGQFEERTLLRFPPVYGSTYFELADFNHDGFPDILYTSGDNADYSPVLKPYHGVYIYLNDGKNNFTQRTFIPMDGCFKAMARDFDGDGDLDIAAISFFADYKHHPEQGFMYLENKGDLQFQPYTFPEAASGRWITMDAGDIYGRGKEDIVLGNLDFSSLQLGATRDPIKGKPFIVLKNVSR